MSELSLVQKFDAVLSAVYCESGSAPTFQNIKKKILEDKKKVDDGEIWDIFNTMEKDGFLYIVPKGEIPIYLISFNGKLLHETGGLDAKLKREKEKELLTNQQLASAITTNIYSKRNIRVGWTIGAVTLLAILANLYITIQRDKREKAERKAQSIELAKTKDNATQLNQTLQEISLFLKDTAKVKGKN